jgi:hypothetical protein
MLEPAKVVHLNELPAIASLRTAVELDPEASGWAREDEDFESLRDDPEFQALSTDRASG